MMKSYITKLLDWIKSKFWNKELELAVVGLQNAGKTTLLGSLATGEYDEDTIPTIGFNLKEIKKGKVGMKMWDLGGQPKFRESWEKYCRNTDCIVFVVDSIDISNMEMARHQLHQLISWPSLAGIPLLVLGNKNDLDGALTEEELIEELNLRVITDRKIACFSISAKDMVNIDITMKWLTTLPKLSKQPQNE
ncbi:adp-ribosylation factor-like protein 8b [Stylonychia lemnae]|uniref:Adp-ribosylation factor-like protein 8b n=1 Tax=Stylonychia lemnae TaxID=5949 RepID=A0A078AB23_STYLE|nr:adp-ribosylation factor-like protein 8b [Stylonychia lemnae]|eukprot:CDW78807.1 adp-ribosylation factor-like protein 8b [Stylonychia lemnae]